MSENLSLPHSLEQRILGKDHTAQLVITEDSDGDLQAFMMMSPKNRLFFKMIDFEANCVVWVACNGKDRDRLNALKDQYMKYAFMNDMPRTNKEFYLYCLAVCDSLNQQLNLSRQHKNHSHKYKETKVL